MTSWRYEHTQTGLTWFIVSGILAAVLSVMLVFADTDGSEAVFVVLITFAIVGIVTFGASRLTTRVNDATIEVAFTFGWPMRRIPRAEVRGHEIVRNSWLLGFGIRYIGRGWMWNVWGLDAVELELANGKRFRIGTNDPTGLHAALTRTAEDRSGRR